ncbi:hypothetical protein ABE096_06410 [Robertmurraya massiliosenegalensis]|uniref:hypothetical protein n=1 Tax=Robertmurraya TaxID=2837507 RepID=UPI0039A6EA7F
MNNALIKCVGIAILLGAFQATFFLGMHEEILLSDIILTFGFSEVEIILVYLIELSLKLLPLLLFQILFGTYIYQHFCTASIYYFSRCPNRVRWFLTECSKLYLLSFIYPLVMVISGTTVASITNQIVFDEVSFILLLYYLLIHSLWLFFTALLINLIAIKLDSSLGFMAVVILQFTCVAMLLLWENVWPLTDTQNLSNHALLLQFNPIAHLILAWHSSPISLLNERLDQFQIDFNLNNSIVVFFFLNIVFLTFGCWIVKKQEWITLQKER